MVSQIHVTQSGTYINMQSDLGGLESMRDSGVRGNEDGWGLILLSVETEGKCLGAATFSITLIALRKLAMMLEAHTYFFSSPSLLPVFLFFLFFPTFPLWMHYISLSSLSSPFCLSSSCPLLFPLLLLLFPFLLCSLSSSVPRHLLVSFSFSLPSPFLRSLTGVLGDTAVMSPWALAPLPHSLPEPGVDELGKNSIYERHSHSAISQNNCHPATPPSWMMGLFVGALYFFPSKKDV